MSLIFETPQIGCSKLYRSTPSVVVGSEPTAKAPAETVEIENESDDQCTFQCFDNSKLKILSTALPRAETARACGKRKYFFGRIG